MDSLETSDTTPTLTGTYDPTDSPNVVIMVDSQSYSPVIEDGQWILEGSDLVSELSFGNYDVDVLVRYPTGETRLDDTQVELRIIALEAAPEETVEPAEEEFVEVPEPQLEQPSCQEYDEQFDDYRLCSITHTGLRFSDYADNILCEGFITKQEYTERNYGHYVSRAQAVTVASRMIRQDFASSDPELQTYTFDDVENDTSYLGYELSPTLRTSLIHKVITPNKSDFRPLDRVKRSEAYAMVMGAVCMYPTGPSEDGWQKKLHNTAYTE